MNPMNVLRKIGVGLANAAGIIGLLVVAAAEVADDRRRKARGDMP